MYNLDPNSSLTVFRGNNPVTREMIVSSTYGDINQDGTLTLNTDFDTNTSGTVAKTFISGPLSFSQIRQVKRIEISNQDTISDKVTIQEVFVGGNTWTLKAANLAVGSSLNYEDGHGWYATDVNSDRLISQI